MLGNDYVGISHVFRNCSFHATTAYPTVTHTMVNPSDSYSYYLLLI
jgi:hypothetical protein